MSSHVCARGARRIGIEQVAGLIGNAIIFLLMGGRQPHGCH
jgi:hypothetical protein